MIVHVVNIRDAEKYHHLTINGDLAHYAKDLLATGERLVPSIELHVPLVVGDIITLTFPKEFNPESASNEKPAPHIYEVFGRLFSPPIYNSGNDVWLITSMTLFVHSMTDETNTNWGDEGNEAGAEGGL